MYTYFAKFFPNPWVGSARDKGAHEPNGITYSLVCERCGRTMFLYEMQDSMFMQLARV